MRKLLALIALLVIVAVAVLQFGPSLLSGG